MKRYEVEYLGWVRHTMVVEANSEQEAIDKTWTEDGIWKENKNDNCYVHNWEVNEVEEQTPDTWNYHLLPN